MSQCLDNNLVYAHVGGDFSTPEAAWKSVNRYRKKMQKRKTYQAALNFQEATRRWLATQRFELVAKQPLPCDCGRYQL